MNRSFVVFAFLLIALSGCYAVGSDWAHNEEEDFIKSYERIIKVLDQKVTISGYLSRTHGASGVYFDLENLDDESEKCVSVRPFPAGDHGSLVVVTGLLKMSGCGVDLICTNTCSDFELLIASK